MPTESSNKFEDPEFVNKFRSSIFRDMLAGGSAADKYFREETDVKFYLCQGKGLLKTLAPGMETRQIETREQQLVAYKEKPSEGFGLLAISSPASIGDGWLVTSIIHADDDKWLNIWDSKNGFDKTPLDDSVKGVVNEFVIDIKAEKDNLPENWVTLNDSTYTNLLSSSFRFNINRKTKNFYYKETRKEQIKSGDYKFDISVLTDVDGECTVTEK